MNDFFSKMADKSSLILIAFGSMVFSIISWSETAGGNKVYALILAVTVMGLEIAKPLAVKAAVLAGRKGYIGSAMVNTLSAAGLVLASLIATIMFVTGSNQNSQTELSVNDPIVAENSEIISRLEREIAESEANIANMPSNFVSKKASESALNTQRNARIEALNEENARLIASGGTGQMTPLNALAALVSDVFDGDVEPSSVIFFLSVFLGCLIELALIGKGFTMADTDAQPDNVLTTPDDGQTLVNAQGRRWEATNGTPGNERNTTHEPTEPETALPKVSRAANSPSADGSVNGTVITDRQCNRCQRTYTPSVQWQRFCSEECRLAFHNFQPRRRRA